MTDYTNTFTSTTGDEVTASELDTQFNNIATSILSKANSTAIALTGTPTVNADDIWHNGDQTFYNPDHLNGYQIFPNGRILQWGFGQAGAITNLTNNFIIPFPNHAGYVIAKHWGALGNGTTNIAAHSTSLSTFTLGSSYPAIIGCFWLCFGN